MSTEPFVTDEQLAQWSAICESTTVGPWRWAGYSKQGMYLCTTWGGRHFVMDFVRQGLQGAKPRFQNDGRMVDADDLAVMEVTYRDDVTGIDHPDARLIAAAGEAVPALLAEVSRLRALVAAPSPRSGQEPPKP